MKWDEMSTKDKILALVESQVMDLLFYDRKECEDFNVGDIESAIKSGVVTVDDMVACYRAHIEGSIED